MDPQLEDLPEGDSGSFQLSGLKCRLADERPQLVAVGCHLREVSQQLASCACVRADEGELEGTELVTKLVIRMAGV